MHVDGFRFDLGTILAREPNGFDQPERISQGRDTGFRTRKTQADRRALGLRPWRCHTCDRRFYAGIVATSFAHYVHCSKCGNFDLEHIARNRVEEGTLVFLKRRLRFPAYRCDPCRHRFFSILPEGIPVPVGLRRSRFRFGPDAD